MTVDPASQESCHVLEEDADLLESIPPDRREQASRELTARTLSLAPGPWDPAGAALPGGIGLLVMRGLMIRRVGVSGRYGAELLGECDILRPWQGGEDSSPTLTLTTGWAVVEPTRIALLDAGFAERMGHHPELAGRLVARAVGRSRNLAVNMAIVHQARVDIRLHMLFWHLAGRWGRVRSDGTVLPVRLTHAVLADLVAARRPTVTSALSELTRRGAIRFVDEGWLLEGDPPGELREVESIPHKPIS